MDYFDDLIGQLKKRRHTKIQITKLKMQLCKKQGMQKMPTDIEVYLHADRRDAARIKRMLQTKPTRTMSGVAVCAIMSYPFKCPHGQCLMCPSKTDEGVPQSYTGKEPAAMRGIRNKFDSYLQVMNRLEQYIASGHVPDKIELIIMGGTFPSFDIAYQDEFVMYAYKAMNDFSDMFCRMAFDMDKFKEFFELPGEIGSKERTAHIHGKLLKLKGKSTLAEEQRKNETSRIRCVGLTIETRPDYAKLEHVNQMLKLGCTRVELGVQSLDDKVLGRIERGHTVHETIEATKTLKDLGFKINYHMMPGLPGSSKESDMKMIRQLFEDEHFMPDMLKIYPCMVVKESKIYELWKKGKFEAMTTQQAASLIAEFKQHVPKFCRIMRVQRDIPSNVIIAGVDRTNLRQYVHEIMRQKGWNCNCIRCREIGRNKDNGKIGIEIMQYNASGGTEFFISAETRKAIYGFCRLRFPSQQLRRELTADSAVVRELHVYGESAEIGQKGKVQHRGIGTKLVAAAEHAASRQGKGRMAIISGIGVREYYRKLGYRKQGAYMVKRISKI